MSLSLAVDYTRPATLLNFQARNDLAGQDGGEIGVGVNAPPTRFPSPKTFTAYETQTVNLAAYDNQNVNGTTWIFNDSEAPLNLSEWIKEDKSGKNTFLGRSASISTQLTTSDNGASFVAYLKKIVNVTFQNNFVGVGNGGTIKVNGTAYSSPTSQFQVVEGNTITAEAQYYYHINGIDYTFTKWSDNSSSLSNTFTINTHSSITANYRGKPTNNGEYVHFGNQVGKPIEIYWTDNPNPNVTQYQIWRRVKHNGVTGPEQNIGTVGRGIQKFVDYDYVLTSSYTNDLLMYDVRAYYSVEQTYSDPNYVSVYGAESLYKKGGETKPIEYSMEVYPNPFNPSTTINYQLPERSFVKIKVYDMLGKEIEELVNEVREAGYYEMKYDSMEINYQAEFISALSKQINLT